MTNNKCDGKENIYIASCSFGKDSLATILLALLHKEPLNKVVYCEVMFDIKNNISGEHPEHRDFIYNTAIPALKKMGVEVDVVRSERDYKYYFQTPIVKGKYINKFRGFPLGGKCAINRDCKLKPIQDFYKSFPNYNIIQYVGIATDEEKRLQRLKNNQISLLAKYGYTEQMALELCKEYGLLSPIYEKSKRNGCWFCPNCTYKEFAIFRQEQPHLWNELKELSKTPNLCSYGFKWGKTFEEVEEKIENNLNKKYYE